MEHLLVESIQTQLVELGHYTGPVDGDWGPGTEWAMTDFPIRCRAGHHRNPRRRRLWCFGGGIRQ